MTAKVNLVGPPSVGKPSVEPLHAGTDGTTLETDWKLFPGHPARKRYWVKMIWVVEQVPEGGESHD